MSEPPVITAVVAYMEKLESTGTWRKEGLYHRGQVLDGFMAGANWQNKHSAKPAGPTLRELREAMPQKWTVEEVGDYVGHKHCFMAQLEQGDNVLSMSFAGLKRFARLYGISREAINAAIAETKRRAKSEVDNG